MSPYSSSGHSELTLLELQSRFGGKIFRFLVVCPQQRDWASKRVKNIRELRTVKVTAYQYIRKAKRYVRACSMAVPSHVISHENQYFSYTDSS